MAALFKENENDLSKKKIEFNHIKVSGEQVSQETSQGGEDKLDLNKIKEENDQKLKKVLVEEIKEKKEEKEVENKKEDKKEDKKDDIK